MPDRAAATAFMDAYRRTFETFDVGAIARLFAFPLAVTGDAADGTASNLVVPDADHWVPALARVLGGYRLIGVAGAQALETDVTTVSPAIAQVTVRWSLRTAGDDEIYEFTAAYTLADRPEGTRVVTIAHDETPKLHAAVARARGD